MPTGQQVASRGSRGRFTPMARTRPQRKEREEIERTVPEEEEVARLIGQGEEEEDEGLTMEGEEETVDGGEVVSGGEHVTRTGAPDRRFKGQRDLPPVQKQYNYRQPRQGGVHGGVHVTVEGKPDRRFRENRNLDEEEVMRKYAENLAEQFGIGH